MSESIDCHAIKFQMQLIGKELEAVAPLFAKIARQAPDAIEIRAVGSVFQAFYNGAEAVIEMLLGQEKKFSSDWHKRLLESALNKDLISDEMFSMLDQFRRFRHKYRHSYGFTLNWEMMKPLNDILPRVYARLKEIVEQYCSDEEK